MVASKITTTLLQVLPGTYYKTASVLLPCQLYAGLEGPHKYDAWVSVGGIAVVILLAQKFAAGFKLSLDGRRSS